VCLRREKTTHYGELASTARRDGEFAFFSFFQ
jgi:hypothetical protein